MDRLIVTLRSEDRPDVTVNCDAIRLDGVICLVPEWIRAADGLDRTPARLIRLLDMPLQRQPGPTERYILPTPLPAGVLAGRIPLELNGKVEVVYVPPQFPGPA